jgi:hypothetical protein
MGTRRFLGENPYAKSLGHPLSPEYLAEFIEFPRFWACVFWCESSVILQQVILDRRKCLFPVCLFRETINAHVPRHCCSWTTFTGTAISLFRNFRPDVRHKPGRHFVLVSPF